MRAGLISLLFPPKCPSCGALLRFEGFGKEQDVLCADCKKRWNSDLLDACGICGNPVSTCECMTEELQKARIAGFRKRVYYIHGTRSATQNRILFKIKEGPAAGAIGFLADELQKSLTEMLAKDGASKDPAVLCYFPRNRRSAAVSGTDQGKRLAEALSERTGIPVVRAIRRRRGKETEQKHLNSAQRRKNAKATYISDSHVSVKGKNVILIDDIVTTGSTMAAGARILRQAGAERIYALSVAMDDTQKNGNLRQPTFRI